MSSARYGELVDIELGFHDCRRTRAGKYTRKGEHPVPSIDVYLAAGAPVRGYVMEALLNDHTTHALQKAQEWE